MAKDDYRVVIHTIFREEPFTWYFEVQAEAEEFFESVKKDGITVMTPAGAAVVTPNSFKCVTYEGLDGIRIKPSAAAGGSQAIM